MTTKRQLKRQRYREFDALRDEFVFDGAVLQEALDAAIVAAAKFCSLPIGHVLVPPELANYASAVMGKSKSG